MKNPWELLVTQELLELMLLTGCDRKYIDGNASDFEKFRELCAIFPKLRASNAAEDFLTRLSDICGRKLSFESICKQNARAIWLCACTHNYSDEKFNNISFEPHAKISVEKENIIYGYTDINSLIDTTDLSEFNSLCDFCKYIDNQGNYPILMNFKSAVFLRPNRYSAEQVFKKISNGEKYNFSEYNLLLCQIICELIFLKNDGILQLILQYDEQLKSANSLINYLIMRKLKARIFLYVSSSCSSTELKSICLLSNELCFITPILNKKKIDADNTFLQSLSRIYPSGCISYLQ